MKRLIIKVTLFSLPLLAFFLPAFSILKNSGENYLDVDHIIENQSDYLIGYAYNEDNYSYIKRKEVFSRPRQHILALGSSRVLQFRQHMFGASFYNAGFTVSSITDFIPFLQSIPEDKYPEVLIISLDQWMFNENWDKLSPAKKITQPKATKKFTKNASLSTILSVWRDLLNNKYSYASLRKNDQTTDIRRIGLNAHIKCLGFRKDGSMLYGGQIQKLTSHDTTAADFKFRDTFQRIDKGIRQFMYGSKLNPSHFEHLTTLLQFCKKNRIYVSAIIPPFADQVNLKMKASHNFSYINDLYPNLKRIFELYGFEVWDMSALATYNSGDHEMIDGFHGSEVTYQRILLYLIEHKSILIKYTLHEQLKTSFESRVNNYSVYGD